MLATQLLEGYTGNNWSESSNLGKISDAQVYIQEACIEFVTEASNLVQQYYTADILGQASVLTEGADPVAIMEANKTSLWQKFKKMIKTLIEKIKRWLKKVRDWFKKKIHKAKKSAQTTAVEKVVKNMDNNEPIRIPRAAIGMNDNQSTSLMPRGYGYTNSKSSPTSDASDPDVVTCPVVMYDLENGDNCANDVGMRIQKLITQFMVSAQEIGGDGSANRSLEQFNVDDLRKDTEQELGFPIEEITARIQKAYGVDKSPVQTVITAGIAKDALSMLDTLEKNVEIALKNVEELPKALEQLEQEFSRKVEQNKCTEEVMLAVVSGASLLVQAAITTNNAIISVYNVVIAQCQAIVNSVSAASTGTVQEGTEPDDENFSDPPEKEEEVTEGTSTSAIKKWINSGRDLTKRLQAADKKFNKKQYKTAKAEYAAVKKELKKMYDEYNSMTDDRELAGNLLSGFGAIGAEVVLGFDSFVQNAWIDKTIKSADDYRKARDDSNQGRNATVATFMAKINACIKHCDRRIDACEKHKDESVSESTIWEQAADYL